MVEAKSQISQYYVQPPCIKVYHVEWDDVIGPELVDYVTSFSVGTDIDIASQFFDISSGIFGNQGKKGTARQMVFVPLANVGKMAIILFDYRLDEKKRGRISPFIFAVVGDIANDDYILLRRHLTEAVNTLRQYKKCDLRAYYDTFTAILYKKRKMEAGYGWSPTSFSTPI